MFKNYLKTAWRNIIKNQFYSIINIIGLAAGITFTFIIGAYVWSQLQVNANLKDVDNQYIIQSKWKNPNMGLKLTTLAPLAKALKEQYPNLVANYYREDGITINISNGDKNYLENVQPGDSTLLSMFGFSLLYGNARTALNAPFSMVITKDEAIKYFGKTNVVRQTLSVENMSGNKHDFTITGVLKNPGKNSITTITGDVESYYNQIYTSPGSLKFFGRSMIPWRNKYIISYIELQKGVTAEDLKKPMQRLIKSNAPATISDNLTPYLVPLKEYYLTANNGLIQKMIYALSFIALFILLMAVINFINMSVSRSSGRMKEIGIRKVLGGLRRQLIFLFLLESEVIVLFATALALFTYSLTRSFFSHVMGNEIPSFSEFPLYFIAIPLVLAIIVGLLAGIYPAFVLSSLKSVDSLKGKLKGVKENIWLRKSLVGFQFCIAAIVFIGAIIVSQQINFFFSNDLGYNKDYVVSAQLPRDWSKTGIQHMEAIRKQFEVMPQIKDVSLSYEIPNGNSNGLNNKMFRLGEDPSNGVNMRSLVTDKNFATTYQIPMASGQFFNASHGVYDSTDIVINEAAAKALGWTPLEAVSQQVKVAGLPATFTIVGVTKNFHFASMQENIKPIWFANVRNRNIYRYFSFKIKPGNVSSTISALKKKWSKLMPGAAFDFHFMDDTLKNLYKTEIQLKQASYTATFLALIIVLLGVLGLVSLSIQKRTKEIGIRKVLGASVSGIIGLFLKEFLLIIFIAGIIACPLAYIIMQNWLNEYAYRINITVAPFVVALFLLALITVLLIIIQAVKAARANPVKSLRTE